MSSRITKMGNRSIFDNSAGVYRFTAISWCSSFLMAFGQYTANGNEFLRRLIRRREFTILIFLKFFKKSSHLKKLVIAIDGPAASGKSTTARLVAERLGYLHIDTGAMYRAMTLKVLRSKIDPADSAAVGALTSSTRITIATRDRPRGRAARRLTTSPVRSARRTSRGP